uniref:glycosyltransferase n=1 Tax=Winogradskyella poriferorum TaxID=307627 RepID=UPI003D64F987
SALVLSRSVYTRIMDLAKLGKRAFFIPSPGQYEQEYLAQLLDREKIVPYCHQEDFELEKLNDTIGFSGFVNHNNTM